MFKPEKLCALYLLLLKLSCSSKASVSVRSVCSGGQLNLTCNTVSDNMLLTWNMTFPHRPGYELRVIFSTSIADSASPLMVEQAIFQFFRTSISPLISTMVIDNVNTVLNGTIIRCYYGHGVMETTIINVTGNGMTPPIPVIEIDTVSVRFENETVAVTLEWSVESGMFSGLSVVPQAEIVSLGPSSRQLVISYNTSYNVSAVASLCGQYISHSIEIFYVKCVSPLRLINEQTVIADYSYPATEGTTAMFSCHKSGYVFTGPSTATCMENGEWVPDPRHVQCEAINCRRPSVNMNVRVSYNSTLFNARLQLTCADGLHPSGAPTAECHSNGSWIPNPADFICRSTSESENSSTVDQNSIIAAVVSSVITAVVFFILGCASGWFGHKYKDNIQARSEKNNTNTQPVPLYEDLQPTSTSQDQEKAFELKKNVAYGPVTAT